LKEWAANVESVNLASELTVALYFNIQKMHFEVSKNYEKNIYIYAIMYTSHLKYVVCYATQKRQNYRSRYVNSAPSNLVRIILFV
jgi:hypothetical protein